MVLPGLINSHVHLELSWMAGRVRSTRAGLVDWIERQLHYRAQVPPQEAQERAAEVEASRMFGFGTAGVFDISNSNFTAPLFAGAGISGVVQHELLTMDRGRLAVALERVGELRPVTRCDRAELRTRPGPHALYSTAPQLVRASAEAEPEIPFSIHISEAPEELEFIAQGSGPLARFMDDLGVDWRWWEPVGISPVAYLDALGLLGPRSLLVHGVELDEGDIGLIAKRGAPLCVCPRSNRWISGRLPDVSAVFEAGVLLCLGTDSLASNSSHDLFEEIAELGRSFPDIGMDTWLAAAAENGAGVLGTEGLGRIEVGFSPGLLWLRETPNLEALRHQPPSSREWLTLPRGVCGG